jgi:hypothetical protein
MVLEDRLSSARQILEAHNKQASESAQVDVDAFFKKLADMGGTTEEALSEATWEDLQDCGAPRILARKIATIWRGEEAQPAESSPQKIVVEDNDPVKRAARLTPAELIAEYDPEQPHSPVYDRLKALAEGQKFLVFDDDGKVNVKVSVQLFDELADYGERDRYIVGGTPCSVRKVGYRPGRTTDEHPLSPGTPLRKDGCSAAGCNWGEVDLKIRQIYCIAVKIGELNPADYREADLHLEATTRDEEEIMKLYQKASIRWKELKDLDRLPSLRMLLGSKGKSERPNHPFGTHRVT